MIHKHHKTHHHHHHHKGHSHVQHRTRPTLAGTPQGIAQYPFYNNVIRPSQSKQSVAGTTSVSQTPPSLGGTTVGGTTPVHQIPPSFGETPVGETPEPQLVVTQTSKPPLGIITDLIVTLKGVVGTVTTAIDFALAALDLYQSPYFLSLREALVGGDFATATQILVQYLKEKYPKLELLGDWYKKYFPGKTPAVDVVHDPFGDTTPLIDKPHVEPLVVDKPLVEPPVPKQLTGDPTKPTLPDPPKPPTPKTLDDIIRLETNEAAGEMTVYYKDGSSSTLKGNQVIKDVAADGTITEMADFGGDVLTTVRRPDGSVQSSIETSDGAIRDLGKTPATVQQPVRPPKLPLTIEDIIRLDVDVDAKGSMTIYYKDGTTEIIPKDDILVETTRDGRTLYTAEYKNSGGNLLEVMDHGDGSKSVGIEFNDGRAKSLGDIPAPVKAPEGPLRPATNPNRPPAYSNYDEAVKLLEEGGLTAAKAEEVVNDLTKAKRLYKFGAVSSEIVSASSAAADAARTLRAMKNFFRVASRVLEILGIVGDIAALVLYAVDLAEEVKRENNTPGVFFHQGGFGSQYYKNNKSGQFTVSERINNQGDVYQWAACPDINSSYIDFRIVTGEDTQNYTAKDPYFEVPWVDGERLIPTDDAQIFWYQGITYDKIYNQKGTVLITQPTPIQLESDGTFYAPKTGNYYDAKAVLVANIKPTGNPKYILYGQPADTLTAVIRISDTTAIKVFDNTKETFLIAPNPDRFILQNAAKTVSTLYSFNTGLQLYEEGGKYGFTSGFIDYQEGDESNPLTGYTGDVSNINTSWVTPPFTDYCGPVSKNPGMLLDQIAFYIMKWTSARIQANAGSAGGGWSAAGNQVQSIAAGDPNVYLQPIQKAITYFNMTPVQQARVMVTLMEMAPNLHAYMQGKIPAASVTDPFPGGAPTPSGAKVDITTKYQNAQA